MACYSGEICGILYKYICVRDKDLKRTQYVYKNDWEEVDYEFHNVFN
ncbi:MAG: hypothetical protein J6B39_05000 [Lachnospiraceae bacterium]|nr:hypothetical protein [Lachnospiraceae bacterium]